jgi:hypothetical protein
VKIFEIVMKEAKRKSGADCNTTLLGLGYDLFILKIAF